MGVYINGMEMPTNHPMWIVVHPDGTVEANEVSASRPVGWQTLRNAAVHVPEHGRLIDADVLISRCVDEKGCYYGYESAVIGEAVESAPTVIEAEEGE